MNLDDVYKLANDIGLIVESFVLDGQWHRVPVVGKRKTNLAGAYCLSEFVLRNKQAAVVGMLSNWVGGGREERITLAGIEGATAEDIAEAKRRSRAAAEASRREKIKLQTETAQRAEKIWQGLPPAGRSPYLDKKRVGNYGVRFSHGSIVVPARDIDGKLRTLQFIAPDGNKKFLSGGAKRGNFHNIDLPVVPQAVMTIGVAEGYATGATIIKHCSDDMALAMVIAFDVGNLLPVGEALRSRYPKARIIFFADNDVYGGYPVALIRKREISFAVRAQVARLARLRPEVAIEFVADDDPRLTDREKHFNVGVTKAVLAAAVIDGEMIVPRFKNNEEAA